MTQTFGGRESLPVTISQLQRLAKTFQQKMQYDGSGRSTLVKSEPFPIRSSPEPMVFTDRRGAGGLLAARLSAYANRPDVAVVAISQGGIPVAAEVSRLLQSPLAVWVSRKLRAHVPCAGSIGAVAEDGELIIDEEAYQKLRIPATFLVDEVRACRAEVKRRAATYRAATLFSDLADRTLIVVDEGAVAGHTMSAALTGLKRQRPRRIVIALPVAPVTVARRLGAEVDETIVLESTFGMSEVGQYYVHFPQVSTEDNVRLLHRHRALTATALRQEEANAAADYDPEVL